MGNDQSIVQSQAAFDTGHASDNLYRPAESGRDINTAKIRASHHTTTESVTTEKIKNLRASKKRSGQSEHSEQDNSRLSLCPLRPEPVFRSASQIVPSQSELTPTSETEIIQKLKHKSYQAILLHASATGRNAVLNLSYSVSVNPCGHNDQARRILVTARGTPTVIVQARPLTSQQAYSVPLSPLAVPAL
jgi:hypothetical protein